MRVIIYKIFNNINKTASRGRVHVFPSNKRLLLGCKAEKKLTLYFLCMYVMSANISPDKGGRTRTTAGVARGSQLAQSYQDTVHQPSLRSGKISLAVRALEI